MDKKTISDMLDLVYGTVEAPFPSVASLYLYMYSYFKKYVKLTKLFFSVCDFIF